MNFLRKTIFLKLALLGGIVSQFVACNNETKTLDDNALKGHLSADLVERPNTLNQNQDSLGQLGKLVFKDTIHDFGNIKEGEVLAYEFEFENKGTKDVLISDAKASCGCTAADYPDHPIKAGEKNKIKVTFDSQGRKGINDKGVTVSTNGNPHIYYLIIKANVN